ncbi:MULTISPECIES: helix-turn-helix transcriptional regulator [Dethiosulfovibrio]|uniref:YheO domain protein n=3 Tax=Dethiosulfovibrio TaxID=47054 RepID=D2Z4X0_9BACT|nr:MULTISPECIES: helix-turn-helix transcriptional regulator [Dethiosulfovibrio]MEA3284767.1 helix-turn-helix transcriptional regulator [Synergistota bacterium]EFC92464.1 YheO domain protein [Dethiosulfovibrio peptidovorans DSM 11002]MCF4113747.1 helix-turn-helix transcriptional regulator [Dethiosulfovibrio russensis]MCF4141840.1 helix-turn-helix transcriptional regulator [Dethiosulfovibrio marinus]MCF4143742.1 helix-turn-helix transcriptional regulator [Dethiosulfovibrio acidaminovorans]
MEKLHPILRSMLPMVKGLALALGPDYEVVLHDVSDPDHSVVAIENGHVTGRSVGSPLRDFALYVLKSAEEQDRDYVVNYLTRSKDGKRIRSNTFYLKDDTGEIVGYMCVNYDMTKAEMVKGMVDFLVAVDPSAAYSEFDVDGPQGKFEDLLERNLRVLRGKVGKPLHLCSKQECLEAVKDLDEGGFFLLKGAVETLAQETGKTKYTIYSYIREVRKED